MTPEEMLAFVRKNAPDMMARDILSVQPIGDETLAPLFKAAKSEKELRDEGFEPISSLGLMWVKKNED